MKTCIYCGSQNKDHKSNCKQCGAPLFTQKSVGVVLPRPEPLQGDLIYSTPTNLRISFDWEVGFAAFALILMTSSFYFLSVIPWLGISLMVLLLMICFVAWKLDWDKNKEYYRTTNNSDIV